MRKEKNQFPKTERNQIRRLAKRGKYDKETVYQILDNSFLCHIGFVVDEQPFVIPTLYARVGDDIYIHGSTVSRMLNHLGKALQICLTVTLVDGLVLARSAFHHSINYRSAMVFGQGQIVENKEEKLLALKAITDRVMPARWEDARLPNDKELNITSVIKIEIESASAKIREGMPVDDHADHALPVWAGVVPLVQSLGTPVADPQLAEGIFLPDYLKNL